MNDPEFRQAVQVLQAHIHVADYYFNRYEKCLERNGMTFLSVAEKKHAPQYLMTLLNEFWDALPDSPHIRVEPFFTLCDLCSTDVYDETGEQLQ